MMLSTEETEKIKSIVCNLLSEGYAGIIGLRKKYGNVGPYFFKSPAELNDLVFYPKYLLSKFAVQLLVKHPRIKIGIIARECDVRALKEFQSKYEINLDHLYIIGLSCPFELAEECNCLLPSGSIAFVDRMKCRGCGLCVADCQFKAIELKTDQPNFQHAVVNKLLCKGCGICVATCCNRAITLKNTVRTPPC